MTIVTLVQHGEVAVILADHPPVNALSIDVRRGMLQALNQAIAAPATRAIVIACKGTTFFAGADITEFGKPKQPPVLQDVIAAIEAASKPVVAAIHGTALGGGLEVALGAHFRVALPSAQVGLPEIKLGIFPGAGGTQRLPRLIGPIEALKLILSGERVSADKALALGIIDHVEDDDPVSVGVAFARRVIAESRPVVGVRDRDDRLAPVRADPSAFEAEAAAQLKRRPGQDAPAACVDSVRLSFTTPIDEALAQDRARSQTLVAGDQSRALRHVFFAERAAAKLPHAPAGITPRRVQKAAIVGAGTMGGGIAMCFAAAGIPVTLIDATEAGLAAGTDRIRSNYATSVKRGSTTQDEMDRRLALIAGTTDRDATNDADIVIEAVFESMDLKQEIFRDLARKTLPGTILATNTSALDIDDIANMTDRPEDIIGMHFFSPANVMRLLEVVRGGKSGWQAITTAMAVAKVIGKIPVLSGNCDGFIGNRMVAKRSAQVDRLLLEGAMPADIDAATKAFGFAMGPLETNDMSGLDIGWSIRKRRGTPFPIADIICERGWFGQKTGQGYYRYESGDRTPRPNPDVESLILETSAKHQIARRAIDRQELIERMVYPLINEGARILEEGIARRASDVDIVWINGYGFPAWRGGPMFYADLVGLATIAERLDHFATQTGNPDLKPARLLRTLAQRNTTFDGWDKDRTLAQ
jgi:3-hydroxyacyl-CoA dehydrogenase